MNTTRRRAIILLHEDFVSSIATWCKAFTLAPAWLLPLLPAIGGLLAPIGLDDVGIIGLTVFYVCYFARDLLRKRIVLDDKQIRHGFSVIPVTQIKSVEIKSDRFRLPNILILKGAGQLKMKLFVSRLSGEDMQTLVDTVQKMSPQCSVDSQVDDILRRKATKLAALPEALSTVSIAYHAERVWSDLPRSFVHMLRAWSRVVGPLGASIILLPLSVWFSTSLYQIAQVNWGSYEQHRLMYDTLVAFVQWWSNTGGSAASLGMSMFSSQAAENPAVFIVASTVVIFALFGIGRALLCANRITMDKTEISLDRWTHLFSFNTARISWSSVEKVQLLRTGSRQKVVFSSVSTPKPAQFLLDLNSIDGQDRARLLQAIRRFAPNCVIDSELIELLEPTGGKSYTQLWLQSLASAPERKTLEPIKAGELLDKGRYEVIRRLGVGGQGTAYLCYDLGHPELERAPIVVLKETLAPVFVDTVVRQKTIEQFAAEAKMLEKIESPNVVKMMDYFVDSRGTYLVLEHIEGQTLRQLIGEQGQLAGDRVHTLAVQMLEILQTLHAQEIIHRDFTPDNLILTPEGVLKLIDFNVAQEISEGTTATIVGKHAYVPPEQFRGKANRQSDLYAFGATLFYLMTGHDPEPISQSCLPEDQEKQFPELDHIVRSCTTLDTQERAQSAAAVLSALMENKEALVVSQQHIEDDGARLNMGAEEKIEAISAVFND